MADRHESDGRESPESPQTGRSGELHPVPSGATSTERDDTHVSAENEYFTALDLDELGDDALGGEPEDLAQIRSDDELLDALAAQYRAAEEPITNGHGPQRLAGPGADFDDEQLNALLLAWRQDVDSVPVPDIVDTKTALATVTAARSARRRRPRLLVPIAVAAAVVAIGFAGVGMLARDAQPGDALWGLSKVLYADHARSVEAAQSVRTDLNDAQTALQQGKIDEAKDALQAAGSALSEVSREDGKDALQAKHESLLEQLTSSPAPTSPPPTQRAESTVPVTSSVPTTSSPPSTVKQTDPPSTPPSSVTTPPSTPPPSQAPNSESVEPPPGNGPGRSDVPNPNGTNGVSSNSGKNPESATGT